MNLKTGEKYGAKIDPGNNESTENDFDLNSDIKKNTPLTGMTKRGSRISLFTFLWGLISPWLFAFLSPFIPLLFYGALVASGIILIYIGILILSLIAREAFKNKNFEGARKLHIIMLIPTCLLLLAAIFYFFYGIITYPQGSFAGVTEGIAIMVGFVFAGIFVGTISGINAAIRCSSEENQEIPE